MKGRHPRPIRRHIVKYLSIPRPVRDEPMSPGLRKDEPKDCIGFHHRIIADDDEDE
jgi:hypothetical protein